MASKDFEAQQLFKAYRAGLISDELLEQQLGELCAAGNGKKAEAKPAKQGFGFKGVTGDAGLDAPGGMAKLMQKGKTYDRGVEDLGNMVAFEHVNVTVPDQQKAALFYINGLGLTRDPYMMTGQVIMWINAGRQQFHLPMSKPQVVRGHVGVVVSDYNALPERLTRLREVLADTCFECHERDGYIEAVCPWGNHIRCFAPNQRFGAMAVGIPYVEFDVPTGTAAGIARFYTEIIGAQAAALEDANGRFACVAAGASQNLFFRETDRPLPPYDKHHIAVYINDFSGPHRRLAAKGLITQESDQHQYRFEDIIDVESGKVLYNIEHEVRSMKHPMYLRPLVNRNPSQSIMSYAPGEDAQNWAMAIN